jgi:hypothetical protein
MAYAALDTPRPDGETLTGLVSERVLELWPKSARGRQSSIFHFVGDSWLLDAIHVPGDACTLELTGETREELLRDRAYHEAHPNEAPYVTALSYSTHNCDGPVAAYGLLAGWLAWYEVALSLSVIHAPV